MREVEKLNFNQYQEGFEKSQNLKKLNSENYPLFNVEETEELGYKYNFNTDNAEVEITQNFSDGRKTVKSYSLLCQNEEGDSKYSVVETHFDENGNEKIYNGTEFFDKNGKSYFCEFTSENEDNKEIHFVKSQEQIVIEGYINDEYYVENFNTNGELISYKDDYMKVFFEKEGTKEVKQYCYFDSNGNITEDYSNRRERGERYILFNDEYGNSTTYNAFSGGNKKENLEGSIVKENSDGTRTETYFVKNKDKNTQTIKTVEYDVNGKVISRENKIDSNNDGLIDNITKLTYDENRKRTGEERYIDYDKDGNFDDYTNFTFDKNGEISNKEYEYYASGVITENTKQGGIGDCAIFSGLNGFSYCEKGQEILKESLTQNEDGSFSVYFKGLEKSFTVSQKDIYNAKQEGIEGSPNDNTQLVYLLAIKKAFSDIRENKSDYSIHENLLVNWDKTEDAREGGNLEQSAYLLTGKESIFCLTNISQKAILKKIKNHRDEIIANANFTNLSFKDKQYLTDVNGEKHLITWGSLGGHACAIKAVTDDTVTIVNPWNGSEEIIVDKKQFLKNVTTIEYVDLNEERSNKTGEKIKQGFSKALGDFASFVQTPINVLSGVFRKIKIQQ